MTDVESYMTKRLREKEEARSGIVRVPTLNKRPWANYYQGMYKILINGETANEGKDIAQCREIITKEIAPFLPDGTKIVVRQSNPAKRHIRGYFEPDQEAYTVENGLAKRVWKKGSSYQQHSERGY